MRGRTLAWDGCVNVRDLGGLPTDDGGETRFRAVVRADSVRQLSDVGWKALVEYGVGCVIDLRLHSELAVDPPRELPVDVVHVPVVPDLDAPDWQEIDEIRRRGDDVTATRDVYLELLERYNARFGEAVRAIAAAPPGPVLVHCLGGKDRTGLVVALVLRLAAVRPDAIAGDYALSGDCLAATNAAWIAEAGSEEERELRRRICATPAESMHDVVRELDRRHGSAASYLRAAGVPDEELVRVRARLRG